MARAALLGGSAGAWDLLKQRTPGAACPADPPCAHCPRRQQTSGATLCKPHFSTPADTGMSFDVVKDQELAILGAGTSDEYLRSQSSAKED